VTHTREVVPGVHAITLPLPFELNHINVFLVALNDGYLLIDCGLADGTSFGALERALASLDVAFSRIRRILVTHGHPDHMGNAPRLIERSGAELLMNPAEAELLASLAASRDRPHWLDEKLAESGVPEALVAEIHQAFFKFRRVFTKLAPDRLLTGGEIIPTAALGDLEVICTPGHSPGHLCLYSPERRLMFSGDHILPGITPNVGWLPGRDMLAEYLVSLDRAGARDAALVVPSHGLPFEDHRAWIEDTKAHHADRCRRILESVAAEPRTIHQLVGDLWNYPLSLFNHRFAIFEVLAHLVYLEGRGEVAQSKRDGVVWWRPVGGGPRHTPPSGRG
jgi:glyoxylase-like metal-dependent hydrolase (beta-lactamase superfamily II)